MGAVHGPGTAYLFLTVVPPAQSEYIQVVRAWGKIGTIQCNPSVLTGRARTDPQDLKPGGSAAQDLRRGNPFLTFIAERQFDDVLQVESRIKASATYGGYFIPHPVSGRLSDHFILPWDLYERLKLFFTSTLSLQDFLAPVAVAVKLADPSPVTP